MTDQTTHPTTTGASVMNRQRLLGCLCGLLSLTTLLLGTAITPWSQGSAAAATTTVSVRLGGSLKHAASIAAQHHRPSERELRRIRSLAAQLLQATAAPTKSCRVAVAAAERMPKDRQHHVTLMRDIKLARRAGTACVSRSTTPVPTPPTSPPAPPTAPPAPPAPQYVGGTLIDANGKPVPNAKVTVDVEYLVGYSGENDTATTDANGRFVFTDLPLSEVGPTWKFEEGSAAVPYNGGTYTVGAEPVLTSDPANLQFQLDGNTYWDNDSLFLVGTTGLCQSFPDAFPITVTLTPDSPLADGSSPTAQTLTYSQDDLCAGEYVTLDEGFWTVTAQTSLNGDPAGISTPVGAPLAPSGVTFDQPSGGAWPTQAEAVIGP